VPAKQPEGREKQPYDLGERKGAGLLVPEGERADGRIRGRERKRPLSPTEKEGGLRKNSAVGKAPSLMLRKRVQLSCQMAARGGRKATRYVVGETATSTPGREKEKKTKWGSLLREKIGKRGEVTLCRVNSF